VRVSRQIKASPERVFDAWLDAETARTFLFADWTSEVTSSEIDARVGGRFGIVRRWDGGTIEYWGEYLEIDRPYRLVFSLYVERHAQRDDRVIVELARVGEESLLVLTHEHSLPTQAESARIHGGWTRALDRVAVLCDKSASRSSPLPWFRAPAFAPWDVDLV
jgi:uncharacterized protein YndB with AHSA1/START domain